MKFIQAIGIDVSKSTIDCCIYPKEEYECFENTTKGYQNFISWITVKSGCQLDQLFCCFEHTGIYSSALAGFLTDKKMNYAVISGLEIKRSMGIKRGKDDKTDARQIALYAYRRKDELKSFQLPEKDILNLKKLLSLREKLVKQRAGYKAFLKEQKQFFNRSDNPLLFTVPESIIRALDKQLDKVQGQIQDIINHNLDLKNLVQLITSIPGVGLQTALHLIAITNGFLLFKNSRKLACYAGIAPFPYQSGVSVKGKTKVSSLANKKTKTLLNTCAKSAITHNPELREYYKRKINNGKHKMCATNAVRNKLLHRVFAVVKRGTPYVDTHAYAA